MAEPLTLEKAIDNLKKAEMQGLSVSEPKEDRDVICYRKAANRIIADRLLIARNRSGLNNDKINKRLHGMYMERNREAKGWTFTNILSPRNMSLPDGEEATMLSQILGIDEALLEIHMRTMPWLSSRLPKRSARKRKASRTGTGTAARQSPAPVISASHPSTHSAPPPVTSPANDQWIVDEKYSTPDMHEASQSQNIPAWEDLPMPQDYSDAKGAGDLKISHDGDNLVVSGKIWCDKETAAKLRMIVPMKLINQERGDNPWCYEIRGQVHAYQLYNIIHVLYKAPQVLKVDI